MCYDSHGVLDRFSIAFVKNGHQYLREEWQQDEEDCDGGPIGVAILIEVGSSQDVRNNVSSWQKSVEKEEQSDCLDLGHHLPTEDLLDSHHLPTEELLDSFPAPRVRVRVRVLATPCPLFRGIRSSSFHHGVDGKSDYYYEITHM